MLEWVSNPGAIEEKKLEIARQCLASVVDVLRDNLERRGRGRQSEFFSDQEGNAYYLIVYDFVCPSDLRNSRMEKLTVESKPLKRDRNQYFRLTRCHEETLLPDWFYKVRVARSDENMLKTYGEETDRVKDKRNAPAVIKFYQDGMKVEAIPEDWKEKDEAFREFTKWKD